MRSPLTPRTRSCESNDVGVRACGRRLRSFVTVTASTSDTE
jgi:hypothetical protein